MKEYLMQLLQKQFESAALVDAFEEKIKKEVKTQIESKYNGYSTFIDGHKYTFLGVRFISFYHFSEDLNVNDLRIGIYFLLNPDQKEKKIINAIKEVKEEYEKYSCMAERKFKTPIFLEMSYEVPFDRINNINLDFNRTGLR